MKKALFLLITATLFTASLGFAQKSDDTELNKLINTISTLRQGKESTWNQALDTFQSDKKWTVMNEIPRHQNECFLIGEDQFKLNRILTQCGGEDKQMTPGDFLNGNDPNFNYSLTEIGIKKSSTVSYELKHRQGQQTFVVMPYAQDKARQIELEAVVNGQSIKGKMEDDGNIYLHINQALNATDIINIDIKNGTETNMAVVLINHNTRR